MQEEHTQNLFGLAHLWASGDFASHAVAIVLVLMSIASWYLILAKSLETWKLRKAAGAVTEFWRANTLNEGLLRLRQAAAENPFEALATQARCCQAEYDEARGQLASRFDPSEQLERALRQQLAGTQAGMESGLTLLATTGATAPFVGLFGTVWGIYHALVAIGISGQAALEKVAGPVGEALIMTAAGLVVALPAVFAYNAFARVNRVVLTDLDAFAHDLHAFFALGKSFDAHSAPGRPRRESALAEVA